MPSLGADMDVGTIVEWRVKPGDHVRRGDIVAEVDTEKSTIEVEIFEDGTITELVVEPGVEVPVGTVLARLTPDSGNDAPSRPHATPGARRAAAVRGLDLSAVTGTGPGGTIVAADLGPATESSPRPAAAEVTTEPRRRANEAVDRRRRTGELMARSKREIPHYYLATTIDLTNALAWLSATNAERTVADRILPAALLLKATALAALQVPVVNGFWEGDRFEAASGVDLGVAVSLRGGGLVAPTVKGAEGLELTELMRALAGIVQRARSGTLRSSDLTPPTITVTNLGDQGVEDVFGVITPPQVALVGFGRIVERPWAVDGLLGVRRVVRATLSADHRASDGHDGARYLAAIDRWLQNPEDR
jgi:pyruvate dehydrogenase E2 component (dihydrolipoamide acetyltransferase)